MATRIKTIEYVSQTVITTLASATNRDLSGQTLIYIPESGITFRSVILQVECTDDNGTTSVTLTAPVIGIGLGTSTLSTATGVNPVANSGEESEWTFTRDVTSYFTTNWSGTSMSWYTRVNFTGPATNNHSSKVIITYEYNDSSNVQIKTIRIPIESTRTVLTTTFQTLGGATPIPGIFGSYLPETGITIRQAFIELWGNTGVASTGTFTLQIRINGGTALSLFRSNSAKNSAPWGRCLQDITTGHVLTGSSTLEALVLTTTSRFCTVGGTIVVTYEFSEDLSTTIYNSLMLGAVDTSGWIGGTTAANRGVWERSIYIEEPDTITLKESALCLYQNDSAGYTFNVKVSGDTAAQSAYSSYVMTQGTIQTGTYSLVHRIDAAGQNGAAGISLKRGKNLYRVEFYSATAQAGWNLSGFLILNYTSGKHSNGSSVHAHSVYEHVTDNITAGGSRVNTSVSVVPYVPETYYYLIGFLFWVNYSQIGNGTTGGLDIDFTVDAEVSSGETFLQNGSGWISLYNGTARIDSDNLNGYIYAAARSNFKRWNGDPDPERLDIKNSRRYRLSTGPLWCGSMGYWYTYNAITYVVSGTCSGYSSDGSGIPINIFRVNSSTQDELVLTTTTIAGGSFSANWIDNTETLYATAIQDSTHVGRSPNGIPT